VLLGGVEPQNVVQTSRRPKLILKDLGGLTTIS
jgi:hypothetical protein